ncbi:pirin family protein [Gordonia humi]|uniref:Pirin family protein n=1 Tax=Gordonia humi TaxID=686429 RepID=A0A840EL55_9ACTN|nr:pirin-like bicupin family protein [Gordonia humi]MBB4133465.1 hypothetical protein [Gordonia humi]
MLPTIHRAADRVVTETAWLTSSHSFSFGDHYDPSNTHHGALLVHNEDVIATGQGFETHPHAETEIITWVLSGSLIHQDSQGNSGVIHPGLAQRTSAGTGIEHSERNDHAESSDPVHLIQMWVTPDEPGRAPSYDQFDITSDLESGTIVPVASGDPAHDSAVRIANSGATLYAVRLNVGRSTAVPAGRFTHLFVTAGAVAVDGQTLGTADALRATDFGGTRITAVADAEVLIWSMSKRLWE